MFILCKFLSDPRLTDYDTLLENVHGLKEGRSVQVPIYDFKTSCRTGYRYKILA
jgi:uridine kinase